MPTRTRRMTALVAASALTLALAACGGGDGLDAVTGSDATTGTTAATGTTETGASPGTPIGTGATGATGLAGGTQTVTAVDYSFRIDGSLPSGPSELVLENDGEEPHEMLLMQLDEGKTVDDVLAAVEAEEPPQWVTMVGAAFARPGQTSDPLAAQLGSGTYVLACFVETKEGVPHAALGMLEEIQVA